MNIEQIDEDIWVADGPSIPFLGLDIGSRMTIIRLGSELWVHSPVSITSEMATQIERLGEVRYVLSSNRYHHAFLSEWRSNYPEAEVYASPGLIPKRPDIAFDNPRWMFLLGLGTLGAPIDFVTRRPAVIDFGAVKE